LLAPPLPPAPLPAWLFPAPVPWPPLDPLRPSSVLRRFEGGIQYPDLQLRNHRLLTHSVEVDGMGSALRLFAIAIDLRGGLNQISQQASRAFHRPDQLPSRTVRCRPDRSRDPESHNQLVNHRKLWRPDGCRCSGTVWSQQGPKLVGNDTVGTPGRGSSVSLSVDGNTAVVGGPADGVGSFYSPIGAAWVFTRSDGIWSQQGPKLVGTGAIGNAQRGTSVSLSADGNTAIVSGRTDNFGIGATWVYTRSRGIWNQQAQLVGPDALSNAQQGFSISFPAMGTPPLSAGLGFDNRIGGAAWVFTRVGGVWNQQAKLVGTGSTGGAPTRLFCVPI
jgi:hypothetical protein